MDDAIFSSGVEAAINAGKGLVSPVPINLPNGGTGYIVPDGFKLEQLAPIDAVLTRVKAAPRFDDRDSFVDYVNRFKSDATVVFADLAGNRMTAIIDYHAAAVEGVSKPDYNAHRATHPCPWSLDWARWRAIDGKDMKQAELGRFLEEMLHTIASPDGAGLLEIAAELKVDRAVKFKAGTRLQNGTVSLAYEEEDTTSGKNGKITIPDLITVVAPVFMGGDAASFKARLRYNINRGDLTFKIDIMNRVDGEQQAFQGVVDHVRSATSQPVFYGAA